MSQTENAATKISPLAGKPAPPEVLIDVARLVTAYYNEAPDPSIPLQRVAFGTSGHRGSAFARTFNEAHVLAISQAICRYRTQQGIDGPLFVGIDTHALSEPAFASTLRSVGGQWRGGDDRGARRIHPDPGRFPCDPHLQPGRKTGLADGIVISPSHNPPGDGGFKYNPPNGGPAGSDVTGWIEKLANEILEGGLHAVRRMPLDRALRASTTHQHDFLGAYVNDLGSVIDMDVIRDSKIRMGVDPLGGAGVHYWARIAERYRLDLTVVSAEVDPTFRFMTLDWDGRIRMDPSSPVRDAAPAGHEGQIRHRLRLRHRPRPPWHRHAAGRSAAFQPLPGSGHRLPVPAPAAMAGERGRRQDRRQHANDRPGGGAAGAQAGRSSGRLQVVRRWPRGRCDRFLRRRKRRRRLPAPRRHGVDDRQGRDGAGAARRRDDRARLGRDPGALYQQLANEFGNPVADRIEAPATPQQKKQLAALAPERITATELAGEKIVQRPGQCAGQRRCDRRRQGDRRAAAGSPRGPPARRTSTRSTPKASAAPPTCRPS